MKTFELRIDLSSRLSDGASNEAMVPRVIGGVQLLLTQGCDRVIIRDQNKRVVGEARYVETDVPTPAQKGSIDIKDGLATATQGDAV